MSLDAIHADGIEANLQRWAAAPPAPEDQGFSLTSFIGAGAKGVPAGALESAGSVSDVLSAYGTAAAASGGGSGGMFSMPTPDERKQEAQARDKMLAGDAWNVAPGNVLRKKAEEMAPDAVTGNRAEQVIFGLTRFGAKAVADVGTMGPAGALVLGLDEGNTAVQNLREKGIDTGTATKVGAVQGVTSAVGAVMPLGGKTILQTLGLVAAGGPGMFMAQEALSRDILQRAGYADESTLHNPFDPLGLVLSTVIPGAFGAVHMRALNAPKLADVVQHIESGGQRYGADGQLLTSPKGAQGEMQVMPGTATDPGFGVTPAKDHSPEELARVGRDYLGAMVTRYGDQDKALAAYNAGPGAVDAAINAHGDGWLAHVPEETQKYVAKARKLTGDYLASEGAKSPEVVDAARVSAVNDVIAKGLPDDPEAFANMQRASDIVAESGGREAESVIPPVQVNELREFADDQYVARLEPQAREDLGKRYASAARDKPEFDSALQRIADEAGAGVKLAGLKGTERAVDKVMGDYRGDASKIKDILRGTIEVENLDQARQVIAALHERFSIHEQGKRNLLDPDVQPVDGYRDAKFNVDLGDHTAEIQVNLPQMLAAKKSVHALYARREQIRRESIANGETTLPPEVDALNAQMRAAYDSAWTEATSLRNADSSMGLPLRLADSGSNARGEGASQASESPGGTPAPIDTGMPSTSKNSALAGKDSGKREGFIGASEVIVTENTAARTAGAFDQGIAQKIAAESPDLRVTLPGSDEQLTVAQALARIAEEHKQDGQWADLLKVAVECALGG